MLFKFKPNDPLTSLITGHQKIGKNSSTIRFTRDHAASGCSHPRFYTEIPSQKKIGLTDSRCRFSQDHVETVVHVICRSEAPMTKSCYSI